MKPYKLQGKEIKVPTSWSEATYDMFVKVQTNDYKSDAEIISVFTGIDVEDLRGKHIGGTYHDLIKDLSFIQNTIDLDYIPPRKITFKGKEVLIPSDIGKEMVGQFSDLREICEKEMKESEGNIGFEALALACSIYIQPIIDGSYSISRAKELVQDIGELPADFVFCMGGFFFMSAHDLPNGFMRTYRKAVTPMMRFKQGIKHIAKRLAL